MRIGVDLGGTKIEVIALSDQGNELFRKRVDTPRDNYPQTLAAIVGLINDAEQATGQQGTVGIGIPGAISPFTGQVKNANSVWLNGQVLDKDISALSGRKVRIANDANCLAVSEATDGAGAGMPMVFAVIIGTGCGSGITFNGRVHAGGNGLAGEWGHNPLPWMDEEDRAYQAEIRCFCGKPGCTEMFVSGTGFMTDYFRLSGVQKKGHEIVEALTQGDEFAELAMRRYERRLARALAQVINLLDPDVIILGGGMSNVDRLYQTLPDLVEKWVLGGECATPIRKAVHGDSSGVRGAAWLWPQ
ncbi:fructokinase [Xenorhabdus nematophila]|uniref:Kinase/transcriptional regulator, actin-like ATPase domain (NagC/XylR (ROK) familiy) n=1 Tax=Xenorhabdus nematophila (strain ATCC 19061 / DSM 3370 / CCUG 14189 / LMG 1036 / NCIMB 9965 / AN6) TaxID=406817 RepID=D3VB33_XENNA|nr:fructokinase [Xenorhabdus nematophila]CBJ91808.1 putative kinase/transcriptional regulator, actin-like ATPase domain (NagC/XylR (ROK) familiy) [Xenorhabdus nematophila ATCC 19061]CCW32877.1 Fructokinase [Xenorhabdus nematophila F1]CEK24627.1 putative kinase/transcriptional regulator, actin-like ATPase domain (NagC/XylR (ROK) familiy) [Xenorhabdus nematophila AN6/1]